MQPSVNCPNFSELAQLDDCGVDQMQRGRVLIVAVSAQLMKFFTHATICFVVEASQDNVVLDIHWAGAATNRIR
jgi:hypothetical protein